MIKIIIALLFVASIASAETVKKNERYYQDIAAKLFGGETEVVMPDRTRCDIVTSQYAIEVDWSHKWAESIGQSLNYAFQTNKRAGIVLITDDAIDTKDALRVNSLIQHYKLPITLWTLDKETEKLTRFSHD